MLELRDIHTYYGDSHNILQGISLQLGAGQTVTLLGRNGAGKTTTINTLIGFCQPRRGAILFGAQEITRLASHAKARLGMGLVPQGRRIFPTLTVRENMTLAAKAGGDGGWTLPRVYETFPRLRERLHHRGDQLSGGEQQMLAFARALMTNPKLMLLDEPSEGLAPLMVAEIGRIIQALKAQGLPILLVEQNLSLALGVSDRVYVMSRGRIMFEGTPAELRANPQVTHKYLGV
jgi:branched-chain amino acid transport system ATP-binding protein